MRSVVRNSRPNFPFASQWRPQQQQQQPRQQHLHDKIMVASRRTGRIGVHVPCHVFRRLGAVHRRLCDVERERFLSVQLTQPYRASQAKKGLVTPSRFPPAIANASSRNGQNGANAETISRLILEEKKGAVGSLNALLFFFIAPDVPTSRW